MKALLVGAGTVLFIVLWLLPGWVLLVAFVASVAFATKVSIERRKQRA